MVPSHIPAEVVLGKGLYCLCVAVDSTLMVAVDGFSGTQDYASLALRLSSEGLIIDAVDENGDISRTSCLLWEDVAGMTK